MATSDDALFLAVCVWVCKNLNCAESFVRTGPGKIYI